MVEAPTKRRRLTLRAGDVFEIPTPDGRLGYGAIVVARKIIYVIIFKRLHSRRPNIGDLARDEIALVGWTMDALIFHGAWTMIGSGYPARDDVPFPNFRVLIEGKTYVTDFQGAVLGPIRADETDLLDQKWSLAPIGFQDAFFALHRLASSKPYHEELGVEYARRRMTR